MFRTSRSVLKVKYPFSYSTKIVRICFTRKCLAFDAKKDSKKRRKYTRVETVSTQIKLIETLHLQETTVVKVVLYICSC